MLDQDEFLAFFERLTHRPDLEHALRLFSSIDDSALTVNDLREFLTNEQQVSLFCYRYTSLAISYILGSFELTSIC